MHLLSLFILLAMASCKKDDNAAPVSQDPTGSAETISYLALGDSYTIGTSLEDSTRRYPVQLAARLNAAGIPCAGPRIIAQNGWTTGDLIEATNDFTPDTAYGLVSLLIGVNNQYQGQSIDTYADEFTLLLNRAIQYAGNDTAKVFVFSIPDYSVTPFGMNGAADPAVIAEEIDQFNEVNAAIAGEYGVSYYPITDISRQAANNANLIASDGLHPSGEMYELWIDAYFDEIKMKLNA